VYKQDFKVEEAGEVFGGVSGVELFAVYLVGEF
jgi:hypothetical protein